MLPEARSAPVFQRPKPQVNPVLRRVYEPSNGPLSYLDQARPRFACRETLILGQVQSEIRRIAPLPTVLGEKAGQELPLRRYCTAIKKASCCTANKTVGTGARQGAFL
jgi:hypothetical protein